MDISYSYCFVTERVPRIALAGSQLAHRSLQSEQRQSLIQSSAAIQRLRAGRTYPEPRLART